ncbi:hypothetical protein MBRA_02485 [Methylobacterium brachiatum]|nr:hypothetical protein MBRA_02485 [Methylobacterium brachiatum]
MTLHTVETRVGIYNKNFTGLVDIPQGTPDIEAFARKELNVTVVNRLAVNPCDLVTGQYYPRMARPILVNNSYVGKSGYGPLYIYGENMGHTLPHDKVALANSVNQLSILIRELKLTMEYIHPSAQNLTSFGHHSRNVLLLASMDFENECRGVLQAHGYTTINNRFSTNDYSKVSAPLRLDEYEVTLSHYPTLGPIRPFRTWDTSNPTITLPWYDAYNKCKHDREANFNQGNLDNAINAVCAVAIMLTAQYRIIKSWRDQIGEFFTFSAHPDWHVWQNALPSPTGWQASTYTF